MQQLKSSQLNQPIPNPSRDCSEPPVVGADRTGQPVESGHEQTMPNKMNMDFRIPGLLHSVVKQADSSRVRELVKKIENHPDRHALQRDLQQNEAYNPVSATAKKMIKDVGNVELF